MANKNKCLAFVLGGGGARGARQAGAGRALFEAKTRKAETATPALIRAD